MAFIQNIYLLTKSLFTKYKIPVNFRNINILLKYFTANNERQFFHEQNSQKLKNN